MEEARLKPLALIGRRPLAGDAVRRDGRTDGRDTVAATTTKYCATAATGQHWSSFRKSPSLLPLQDFPGTAA